MAKFNTTPKGKTTHTEPKSNGTAAIGKQDWKRDRYEQRKLKTDSRRSITGGF